MEMNTICYYCGSDKAVKNWPVTNEPVCLPCRLHFLADEFEETATKEDCDQVRYYSELLSIKTNEKGGEEEIKNQP